VKTVHHTVIYRVMCLWLYSVDDSLTLRLGDSALASTLFPVDYHSFRGIARLPVKWMSMEALEDGIYTAHSDVVNSVIFLCVIILGS